MDPSIPRSIWDFTLLFEPGGLLGIAEGFLLTTSFPVDERKSMSVTRCIPFMSTLATLQLLQLRCARVTWYYKT